MQKVTYRNPDDDLPIRQLILKYQRYFTKYFGPHYAYGVLDVEYLHNEDGDHIRVTSRVRCAHQSTKGKQTQYNVPYERFRNWRSNLKIYSFIGLNKS